MIGTIRKRFDPPLGTRAAGDGATVTVDVARGVDETGRKKLEVDEVEVRRRVPKPLADDDMPPPA